MIAPGNTIVLGNSVARSQRDGTPSRLWRFGLLVAVLFAVSALIGSATNSVHAKPQDEAADPQAAATPTKSGYLIDVPMPIESVRVGQMLRQLEEAAERSPANDRITVVLRFGGEGQDELSAETRFEDALRLARAIARPELRKVKVVSYVKSEISGHAILPVLASDALLVGPQGALFDASRGEASVDQTIKLSYVAIAEQRGLFPPSLVSALVDPGLELAEVTKVGGGQVLASGEELTELRDSGQVLRESVWCAPGAPLRLTAKRLRSARIAAGIVDSIDQASEVLDLASLDPLTDEIAIGQANGVLLDITGAISSARVRRWQSNLAQTLDAGDINTWLVSIDSGGGSLDESATLAAWFAEPEPPLRRVAGYVRAEARADSALIALACKPLYMKPDARLGGPGGESISREMLIRYDELIEQIANSTRRPAALIRGILDPSQTVYRYTNRKTGRVRYATESDFGSGVEDEAMEREKWDRGESIKLADGLTSREAIALGLVDGEIKSLEDAALKVGLKSTPPEVSDRGIVRLVERIGRSNTLAFLLLFIGFAALSAEANAPGLSFPGFIALLCFALYFWMKFLAGTAEWLELIAFTLGIACIAIEIFIVPGFGIFGIGGLALTVLGIVLMSQTFVVPRNAYQVEMLAKGIWVSLGGAAGLVGGFIAMRMMLPHVPLLRGLVMEAVDQESLEQSEKLGDYEHLIGQMGTATTPLRPSGKARIGDQVVQVVSDGTAIAAGAPIRVCEVRATKVVVEPAERA